LTLSPAVSARFNLCRPSNHSSGRLTNLLARQSRRCYASQSRTSLMTSDVQRPMFKRNVSAKVFAWSSFCRLNTLWNWRSKTLSILSAPS
jgi:hypothetical protein